MPASSEKQRKFMAAVLAAKRGNLKNGSPRLKQAAASISESDAADFASKPVKKKKREDIARSLAGY